MGTAFRNNRAVQFVWTMLFALTLAACANIGVPAPETFNQNLAVAVALNTEVRNTAAAALSTNKISVADAENVQKQADTARDGLNVARGLSGTDLTGANNKLAATTAILKALQAYLIAKQGAK